MINDKIKQLQSEIAKEQEKIRNCKHQFGEAFYNPETIKEPYGYKMITQGSDVWGEPEGYRDIQKPRWTRKCSACGLEQHTYETEPIVTGTKPKF